MLGGHHYDDMEQTPVPPAPGGRGAASLVVLIAVIAGGLWAAHRYVGQDPAFASPPDGKPVMLMFTADWCGPCQAFKATVLSDPVVLSRLGKSCGFRTVDLTSWTGQAAERAKHYGVDAVPTLILVNARGREISRYMGPTDPRHFAHWIDQNSR
jgi:thiol:disulfide interchange protein